MKSVFIVFNQDNTERVEYMLDMLGIKGYKTIGSKGDYIILDKRTGPLLPMPIYPVPSNTYMGIHVTNTIDGNVTVGPNAEVVDYLPL